MNSSSAAAAAAGKGNTIVIPNYQKETVSSLQKTTKRNPKSDDQRTKTRKVKTSPTSTSADRTQEQLQDIREKEREEHRRRAIARTIGKEDIGAKDAVELLFGPDLGKRLALLAGRKGKPDWRKVLEPIDAVIQCRKVLKPPSPEGKECYICNGIIPLNYKELGTVHPLYPECEHILPVTSARIYLTLYMSASMLKDDYFKEMLDLEYAWAHRICNQTKSNELFIKELQNADKNIQPNEDTIKETLLKIKTAAQIWKKKKESNEIDLQTNIDVKSQRSIIIKGKIEPIATYLNNKNTKYGDGFMILNRAAFFSDEQYLPKNLQDEIQKYRTSLSDEDFKKAAKNIVEEQLPSWLAPYLKSYTKENVLDKLFELFTRDVKRLKRQYKGKDLETTVQSVFDKLYEDLLKRAKEITLDTLSSNIDTWIVENAEQFHLNLYETMLQKIRTTPEFKNDISLYCQTAYKVKTLRFKYFKDTGITNEEESQCDKWYADLKSLPPVKETDKLPPSIYTEEEDFFEEKDKATQILYQINALMEDNKDPTVDSEANNQKIEELRSDLNKINSKNREIVASILVDLSSSSSSSSSSAAPLNTAAGQSTPFVSSFSYLNTAAGQTQPYIPPGSESSLQGKSLINQGGKGRRKTRRAKLSPHTRLTHRSGRSKKLKTQSSRKSLKGKSKKTSRY